MNILKQHNLFINCIFLGSSEQLSSLNILPFLQKNTFNETGNLRGDLLDMQKYYFLKGTRNMTE